MQRVVPLRFSRVVLAALALAAGCGDDGSPTGGTNNPTPTITLAGSGATLTLAAGTSNTTTFNLTRGGGFTGDVAVSVSGAPAGVTATIAPTTLNSSTTTATLTVATAATTTPGTYPLTVTATGSGVTTQTATLSLTVTAAPVTGNYTLAAAPTTVSVPQGGSGTSTINLTRTGGFAGSVGLAVTGAPAGLTVTLASASTTGNSVGVTVAAAATVAPGTYPLTITGTATGLTNQTTTLTVTVTAVTTGSYTLAVTPTTVSVAQGASASATVNLTRTGGFADAVGLAITGAPAGLTATLASSSTTANSVGITVSAASTVAAGTYPLTITGTATGLTNQTATLNVTVTAAATGSYTLAVTPTTVTLAQGASGTATVNLTRTGGFTGAVGLAITGAPTGLTATLASASTTDNSVGITVAAATTLAAGTYPLTITGTANGLTNQTTTLNVTVTAAATGSFTISVSPTTINLTRGQSTTVTVDIARTGGFTGAVDISVSGLPAGVTATITPVSAIRAASRVASRAALLDPVTTSKANITLTSNASAPTGPFTLTVTAAAAGQTTRTATSTVTVAAPAAGAIVYTFCDATNIPVWVAVQDGTGAWTQVVGANNVYRFDVSSGKGGVAIVRPNGANGFQTTVYYGTTAELTSYGQSQCIAGTTGLKTVRGSVAGLAAANFPVSLGDNATVATSGRAVTITPPTLTFQLDSVPDGARDFIATRQSLSLTGNLTTSKFIIRRDLNPANGATLPVFDFGSSEAIDPVQRTVTVGNTSGETIITNVGFTSLNSGIAANVSTDVSQSAATSRSFFAVPAGSIRTGDVQALTVVATAAGASTTNTASRIVIRYFGTPADQSVTLGASLAAVTTSTLSGSYPRFRAQAPVQTDYANIFVAQWFQASNNRSVTIIQTSGYTGGAAWDVSIPDFTGTTGFNATWMLQSGASVSTTFTATGYDIPGAVIGGTQRAATRTSLSLSVRAPAVRSSQDAVQAVLSQSQLSSLLLPRVLFRSERLTGRRR